MAVYDAVVVGARCAGSVVAGLLARDGWNVLLLDKATFPSDTISTHVMFPNTLARFEALGILQRLQAKHDLPLFYARWRILGFEVAGEYTPVDGHVRATSIRRVALDQVLVEWAIDAGADHEFGRRVVGVLGGEEDRVRGVVMDDGDEIQARWVIGADGRASAVAGALGLEKTNEMAGEMAYLFSYWRGLPRVEVGSVDVNGSRQGFMRNPSEDGIDLLSVAGPPEITRGSAADREKAFAAGVAAFPETFDARQLERAERISDLVVVPERMLRGFFRHATGPGWALIGDAGHFKHPGTAQGISDAVEQAIYVANALTGEDPELDGYEAWREERGKEHYEWSFVYGSWPQPGIAEPYMRGLMSDTAAAQDWLDTFSRVTRPSDVNTPERLDAWFAPTATS